MESTQSKLERGDPTVYYFDLIPEELRYIIVSKLNRKSFKNLDDILKYKSNINYELLLKLRYPKFYINMLEILQENKKIIQCFENHPKHIIIYFDLLTPSKEIFQSDTINRIFYKKLLNDIKTNFYLHPGYESIYDTITTNILGLTSLKYEYSYIYQKLSWFKLYNHSVAIIHLGLYRIINTPDHRWPVSSNTGRTINNNIKNYINTGIIKNRIEFGNIFINVYRYSSFMVLLFLLINEYIHNNANIIFDRLLLIYCAANPPLHSFDIPEYRKDVDFYDYIRGFITTNIDKLKYI